MRNFRHDQPVKIDVVEAEHPHRSCSKNERAALLPLAHHSNERNHKVAEEKCPRNRSPAAKLTREEPTRFFWDVRVPNQHVLAEADVGPEHHAEREEQLAHVLEVLCGDDALQEAEASQTHRDEDHHGEACGCAAAEEVDAEHRREPRWRNRHNPVERSEGRREAEQDRGWARPLLHTLTDRDIARCILANAAAKVEARKRGPHREVDRSANPEERRIQERFLRVHDVVLGFVVGLERLHIRPNPQEIRLAHEPEHREWHEENPHPAEIRRQRFRRSAHRNRPTCTRQVLNEDEEETTKAWREREEERDHVRAPEVMAIGAEHAGVTDRRAAAEADHRERDGDVAEAERKRRELNVGSAEIGMRRSVTHHFTSPCFELV